MTARSEIRQLVSSFLAARDDSDADAIPLMADDFTFESPLMRFADRAIWNATAPFRNSCAARG